MLAWMAWTVPSALVFVFIFSCIGILAVLELRTPGGDPRGGDLGIETTRGDRRVISILGTVFIMLAWFGLYGTPLRGGLAIAIVWRALAWKKV